MATRSERFTLIPGRTTKQGQQINIGKDRPEYAAMTGTVTMNSTDMERAGLPDGATVRVRSEHGEATFVCRGGSIPQGIVFIPYGPLTSRLMSGQTDGTGMPTSKGLEVEIEIAGEEAHG